MELDPGIKELYSNGGLLFESRAASGWVIQRDEITPCSVLILLATLALPIVDAILGLNFEAESGTADIMRAVRLYSLDFVGNSDSLVIAAIPVLPPPHGISATTRDALSYTRCSQKLGSVTCG